MTKLLMWLLSFKLQTDPDYAWGWHCNLAVMAQDAGAPHKEANISAANFMKRVFNVTVDISAYK